MRKPTIGVIVATIPSFFFATYAIGQNSPLPALVTKAPAAGTLPAGPGHDTTVRVCSGCHAPEIAAQQRLSEQGWKDLVETMAGRGAQGSEADFAEIKAYLAKNFPDKPAS
ncbi:MAG TPA: hypothetical protein VGU01_11615 [Sphingomicrobium sp.]|nr:hypothetical protein [Sphingomicrobium sp.]